VGNGLELKEALIPIGEAVLNRIHDSVLDSESIEA